MGLISFAASVERVREPFTLVAEPGCSVAKLGFERAGDPGDPMPAQESDLPPVPDDPVDGPGAASMISTAQLPWTAIPKFVPGTTNVQDYVKKLEFLAAMWPTEHLDLLAPRAALLVEGSAFATIAKLDASKLKVKSLDGVKALVKAIGGSWGATDFEERFEFLRGRRFMALCRKAMNPTTASSPEWRLYSLSC